MNSVMFCVFLTKCISIAAIDWELVEVVEVFLINHLTPDEYTNLLSCGGDA